MDLAAFFVGHVRSCYMILNSTYIRMHECGTRAIYMNKKNPFRSSVASSQPTSGELHS